VSLESFQSFLKWFVVHYCTHFDRIDRVFDPEIEYMEEMKSEFNKQAQIVEEVQRKNIETKKQIEDQLANVIKNNEEINRKLIKIQEKANLLRGDVPNDVILQVFIEKLALKVNERKVKLQSTLDLAKQQKQFEEKVIANLKEISSRAEPVDLDFLHQVIAFLDE